MQILTLCTWSWLLLLEWHQRLACFTEACIHPSSNVSSQAGRLHAPQAAVPQSRWLCCTCTVGFGIKANATSLLSACIMRLFCNKEYSPLQVRFMCSEDAKESITAIMVSSADRCMC